jgi:chemotaxis family two-component system sensor kinase Cph1
MYILTLIRNQYINQQLTTLNNQLEQKNKELERFVYVASHDLKSPIRTIGSFTSLLKRRLKNKASNETEEYLAFIMTGVSRMSEIIESLLDYSQYGFEQIIFESTDTVNLINEVCIQIVGNSKNIEIILDENIPETIIINSNQIKQLFQNLIENGLKYNESDKKIIKIGYLENKSHHIFTIQDNGIGVENKYKNKIFEIFQRLHVNDKYGGTGIGLAICKRIVENHNGFIKLKDSDEQGAIFEIKIGKKLR